MAGVIDWFKKRVEQPVAHFVSNDIVHPVANFVSNDVIHPAENAVGGAVQAVQNAPQTVQNDVISPIQRDVVNPFAHTTTSAINWTVPKATNFPQTFSNDVVRPFQRDVIRPAGNTIKPIVQLPIQFAENYANTFANLGNRAAGLKDQTIQQNLGGNSFLNNTLKFSGAMGTNKQLAGDVGQIGLTAAAPLADKFIANPITEKLAASGASKIGTKFIANSAAGAPVLGAFNAASTAGNGGTANQILTSGLEGAATAPAFVLAGAVAPELGRATANTVKTGVNVAKKANTALENAAIPRVNLQDQATLRDYADYLVGANKAQGTEASDLITQARQIGQKYGTDLTNGSQADRLDRATSILDQIGQRNRQITQGGYVRLPSTQGDSLAALKQEALKYKSADEFANTMLQKNPLPKNTSQVRAGEIKDEMQQLVSKQLRKEATPADNTRYIQLQKELQDTDGRDTLGQYLGNDYGLKSQHGKLTDLYNQAHAEARNAEMNATGRSLPSRKTPQPLPAAQPGKTEMQANRQSGASLPNSITPPEINPVLTSVKKTQSKLPTSKNITPMVQKALNKDYVAHSFAKQLENARNQVAKSLTKSTDTALELVSKKKGTMTDADHQFVATVASALDAKGTKQSQQLAAQLYNNILEHRTATAQTFSAFRDMANNNPDIIKVQAINYLKKHGVELDTASKKQLDTLVKGIKSTQLGTPERDLALHNTISFVGSKIPTRLSDKLVNFWRAGLLTSPITTGGNILGNTGEAVVRNSFVNPVATIADRAQSILTGKRTKTLSGGQFRGAGQGLKDARQYLKTGFDPNNPLTKFEGKGDINYGDGKLGKATSKYVNSVYRGLGAQDKPFRQAAAYQAKVDLAKADAINLKLKGSAHQEYITKSVADPTWEPKTFKTQNTSKAAGEFAVFANETALGKSAQLLKQPFTVNGKTFNGAFRQFILPFTQVPASIAMRIVHRSDLGVGEIANQMLRVRKGLPYDQRAVSEAVGNGTFGPAAIATGYSLSKAGQITGNYPTDPKERALWKSEGKQANSVRIGNRWYSLNYMQPFGTLLGIGDQIHQDEKSGKSPTDIISNATGRAAKSVESQSFLQGVDGLLSAINDPQQSAKQYVNSTASSIVPNIIKTTARATDPYQRDTNNAIDALKGSIPGARESLPKSQDMFGAPLKAYDNPANQLFNPLRPSTVKNSGDKVVNELQRLQDTQNGIIPTQFNKNAISGVTLTDQQVRDLNTDVNSRVHSAWGQIIADPRYVQLSDADKATALKQVKDQIATALKSQFINDNNIQGAKQKPLSATSVSILRGQQPDYLANTLSNSDNATPLDKYNAAVANFNKNSSSMTPIDRYKAQANINKLKVQKNYSNDILTLYGMSKADASAWLSTPEKGVDKAKMAKQLLAYDQALYNAGIASSLKYKNGIALASSGGSSTGAKDTTAAARLRYELAAPLPTPSKYAKTPTLGKALPKLQKHARSVGSSTAAIKPPTITVRKGIV